MKSEVREALACYNEKDLLDYAKEILRKKINTNPILSSPTAVREYLQLRMRDLEHEVFGVIWMNSKHQVITMEDLATGTIDSAAVYPRQVVKAALKRNAASAIFFHNHPSGVATPSMADERITQRLKEALSLIGCRLLDHLIIGDSEVVSFAERGLL